MRQVLWCGVKGFRSLRDVQWGDRQAHLGRRAIVVGNNAVGKSNLFRALDLVLNAAPSAMRPDSAVIEVGHQRGVWHFASGRKMAFDIGVRHDRKTFLLGLPGAAVASDPFVGETLVHLFEGIRAGTGDFDVEFLVHAEVTDDVGGTLELSYERIVVDGRVLVEAGLLVPESGGASGVPFSKYSWLLHALARGYQRIDCPRLVTVEAAQFLTEKEILRLEDHPDSVFWRNRLHSTPANAFAFAERDPRAAGAVHALRQSLLDEHGLLSVSEWADPDSDGGRLRELVLSNLPEFRDVTDPYAFISARNRGTGFEQLVHLRAARTLGGAGVLAVDELEANLSPRAQREIWDRLGRELHTRALGQLLVSSHSPLFLVGTRGPADEVEVWFATLDAEGGTKLARMNGSSGSVAESVHRHFFPLDDALWQAFAGSWTSRGKLAKVFIGEKEFELTEEPPAELEQQLSAAAKEDNLRLVFAKQIQAESAVALARALSVNEWLSGDPRIGVPDTIRVEWTSSWAAASPLAIGLQFCVEGEAPSLANDSRPTELILRVEACGRAHEIPAAHIVEAWPRLVRNLEAQLEALRGRLSGTHDRP